MFTDVITMCERVADHVANIAAVYLRGGNAVTRRPQARRPPDYLKAAPGRMTAPASAAFTCSSGSAQIYPASKLCLIIRGLLIKIKGM